MVSATVEQIRRDLDQYLQRVAEGETVLIVRGDTPLAELSPPAPNERELRPYGLAKGTIKISDDFDAPLPEDILKSFEGE